MSDHEKCKNVVKNKQKCVRRPIEFEKFTFEQELTDFLIRSINEIFKSSREVFPYDVTSDGISIATGTLPSPVRMRGAVSTSTCNFHLGARLIDLINII